MEKQEDQNLKQFAQDWKNNENLQKQFAQNPEKVCDQYHIAGQNKQQMLKMAKEGKNLKERISTFLTRLRPGGKAPGAGGF